MNLADRHYCVGREIITAKDETIYKPVLLNQKAIGYMYYYEDSYYVSTSEGNFDIKDFYRQGLTFLEAIECLRRETIKLKEGL